ncbi:hypothetical protein K505DRAFT_368988 [Melanomma pulvis-pyrius CBS 109.77]|uniref:Uncharacterized protein n=1 Tax=Melanomma pulvis-pyrius CBS 109.77 TaxID=1314802 RepID=A0A6A6WNZ1_9PLEO|nr:hypothetical protein K505DRAFT_368988 [Melanomma pulvis-pyrius CBS 109.77]
MADDSTASTASTAPSTAPSSRDFFTRRPSFFGARNKGHKNTHAGLVRSTTTTPPPPPRQFDVPSLVPNTYQFPAKAAAPIAPTAPAAPSAPSTPPRSKHRSRHSISSSVTDIGISLRRSRSASLRTDTSSGTASSHKRTPSATLALSLSPEKTAGANAVPGAARPALSISTFTRNNRQKSAENVKTAEGGTRQVYEKSPLSAVDNPKTPFGMAVPLRYPPAQKEIPQGIQRQQSTYGGNFNGGLQPAAQLSMGGGATPHIIFQHIHEMASKRISTLDYLRKAHEGRIYWFNTLLFAKTDLTRLPSFTPRNLSRRATHYLLLGFSLPTILDLNANSPTDYLKALNALLLEFEQYQSIHPPDGSTPSSLSRGRIPQMFKRANVIGGKSRRSSSAANDFPALTPQNSYHEPTSSVDSPPTDDLLLLPNESYIHLQTPNLPFDPDFFSTFATLCDVLIDCYTKILSLLSTPESVILAGGGVPSVVGDLFSKADARVRKIILGSVVREFEESCRQGVRGEVGGVGKVVLGGLM